MAKTLATTQTPAPAAVVADKAETKMERAAPIYREVMAMSEAQLGGKTRRRMFMDRAIAELDMKGPGANTYFQNLKNEADGEGRYKYAPSSKATPAQVAASGEQADPVAVELHQLRTSVTALNRTVKQLVKAQTAAHA